MHRLIISAPFGNYIQPAGTTPTLGTFTARARSGRLWRILTTVRYYRRLRAWVNRIGLRNPGMPWLVDRVERGRVAVADKIVSIHGFDDAQWTELLAQIAQIRPLAVELNMSCPNVGEIDWPADLFGRAVRTGVPVIVKLPPVCYEDMFGQAIEQGVRAFHCCNTLPVAAGGVSGQPLKPVALACIRRLAELVPADVWRDVRIVGGGGIREPEDVDDYARAGVHAVAVGTKVMNPIYLVSHRRLDPIRARAAELLTPRPDVVSVPRQKSSPAREKMA